MKQFIAAILTQFQKGELTLQQATHRLLAEQTRNQVRKSKSNRRLRTLCSALQKEQSPAKIRELKNRLSQEFYHGDQVP